ncbi:hypothetical protein J3U75_01670 [Snodgrassella sp. B3088]|uniref:NUDIX hydrolase n=1 Tax=unclassified Snodgrassella TaxID=2625236 RepID=UPI0022699BC5|nr:MULTISPECIES: hypothetical protein [unclassified Snodgrassella]MCX8746106.1 hypothetical protein [Snodgrassella sp. B3800]MCX8748093.1 hypothetical protein [Snodgrassella sp. B3088]MCX8752865.1 hypothetical protein [Snodgrassella sp. B3837]
MHTTADLPSSSYSDSAAELVAVLFAVTDFSARVLTIHDGSLLPFGPLKPVHHSLQAGARTWVHQQTGQPLGYIEQLYTFVDMKRSHHNGQAVINISYLGLVKETAESGLTLEAKWQDWYEYFPWEDSRRPQHAHILNQLILPMQNWVDAAPNQEIRNQRQQRLNLCWGINGQHWIAENALLRYELMYETGIIAESPYYDNQLPPQLTGRPMQFNHRRILATAVSRLRAKLQYRPVIFDLMPPQFTLYQLQRSIEVLNGVELHKQNFRRLVNNQQLVVATGETMVAERGRPAQLYRFNENVLQESLLSGYRLPLIGNHI